MQLEVVEGDITKLTVDAIVNAANSSLLGGGGVDEAIHRAAGPELLDACRKLNGCHIGFAKVTPAYKLPARWVFHAVGPVWRGGHRDEPELLASCYQTCMQLAEELHVESIAFPAISTGVYNYPKREAASIAIATVKAFPAHTVKRVLFCCFDTITAKFYRELLGT